ncbi:MAG: outer membrane protein assembly factor [Ignavibacteriaceae bacterium]|nr:outer membrane protein assembly factor [Ignavibacteriaceae bacterium]
MKNVHLSLVILFLLNTLAIPQQKKDDSGRANFEILPIVNYDSDVGFGFGAKAFLYDFFEMNESFDLILYNSTKGERWYRLVFSLTDFEKRQGTVYPLAFDLILDYDKYNNYKYFGVENYFDYGGNEDYEIYTREQFELTGMFSKGFTKNLVVEAGISYKLINSFNFDTSGVLDYTISQFNNKNINFQSFSINIRYDTRNSFINPSAGFVAQLETESAFKSSISNVGFFKTGLTLQNFTSLFHPKITVASRILAQMILPSDISFQIQLPIGGNRTIRGLQQDRYLSASTLVINNEIRFPIWWRFGGIIGVDMGMTGTTSDYNFYDDKLSGWIVAPAAGLRLYMDNFIVRFDVGFTKEYMGIYFNFGHMF